MDDEIKNRDEAPLHFEEGGVVLPTPEERDTKAEKKEEREYRQEQASIQRGILGTQRLLVLFGVIAACVSLWQANVAQQSADTSQKSVLLAQKVERDSRLMGEKQLIENQAQFAKSLTQMQGQTRAAQGAVGAAQKQIITSMEIFYQEQRPWVGVKLIPARAPASGQATGAIEIVAFNTGRTPALHWKQSCEISPNVRLDLKASDTCEELREKERIHGIEEQIRQIMSEGTGRTWDDVRRQVEQQSSRDVWFGEQSTAMVVSGQTIVPEATAEIDLAEIGIGGVSDYRLWIATYTYSDAIDPTKQHITHVCLKRLGAKNWEFCNFGQEMY